MAERSGDLERHWVAQGWLWKALTRLGHDPIGIGYDTQRLGEGPRRNGIGLHSDCIVRQRNRQGKEWQWSAKVSMGKAALGSATGVDGVEKIGSGHA